MVGRGGEDEGEDVEAVERGGDAAVGVVLGGGGAAVGDGEGGRWGDCCCGGIGAGGWKKGWWCVDCGGEGR